MYASTHFGIVWPVFAAGKLLYLSHIEQSLKKGVCQKYVFLGFTHISRQTPGNLRSLGENEYSLSGWQVVAGSY